MSGSLILPIARFPPPLPHMHTHVVSAGSGISKRASSMSDAWENNWAAQLLLSLRVVSPHG